VYKRNIEILLRAKSFLRKFAAREFKLTRTLLARYVVLNDGNARLCRWAGAVLRNMTNTSSCTKDQPLVPTATYNRRRALIALFSKSISD